MKNNIKFALAVLLVLSITTLEAHAVCGSGSTEGLVPDRPLWFNFSSACQRHDHCYDTCGAEKDYCDSHFRADMRGTCNRRFNRVDPRRRYCLETANTYHSAVHRMGGDAYRRGQHRACN